MARAILPSPPPFRKKKRERRLAEIAGRTNEKETRGRREEGEGRDIRSGVSAGTTEDIALCFLSGQMIYRVSPYIAASYYNPAKTRKGLRESPWVGDGGEGMASRKRNGRGRGRGRGGGARVERKGEPYDMGGITYLWASGTGTEANFRQILVGNNVRAIGT